MKCPSSTSGNRRRAGLAVAGAVVLLVVLNIAALGMTTRRAERAALTALRAETARAFTAAESGLRIAIDCLNASLAMPVGEIAIGDHAVVTIEVIDRGGSDVLRATGTSGSAIRVIEVVMD